jgi:hypothetical protein
MVSMKNPKNELEISDARSGFYTEFKTLQVNQDRRRPGRRCPGTSLINGHDEGGVFMNLRRTVWSAWNF